MLEQMDGPIEKVYRLIKSHSNLRISMASQMHSSHCLPRSDRIHDGAFPCTLGRSPETRLLDTEDVFLYLSLS